MLRVVFPVTGRHPWRAGPLDQRGEPVENKFFYQEQTGALNGRDRLLKVGEGHYTAITSTVAPMPLSVMASHIGFKSSYGPFFTAYFPL